MSSAGAFEQGYLAYWNRIAASGNPCESQAEYNSWERGWLQGHLEDDEGWVEARPRDASPAADDEVADQR